MNSELHQQLDHAATYIRSRCDITPRVGLILGSGLGSFADSIESRTAIAYSEIPAAAFSPVAGHAGRLVLGRIGQTPVVAMQGRVHYYEGSSLEEVVFLPRLLAWLGAKTVIVTNAAGGVNADFHAGDLMLISDHINGFGVSPLRGRNDERLGPRFPDMSEAYPLALRSLARDAAASTGLQVREGVYLGIGGPAYETPAEIRMFRQWGADAVGMSTVPEVTALVHMGVRILGISCITNMAAGILPQPLTHDEVLETTARVAGEFAALLRAIIAQMER